MFKFIDFLNTAIYNSISFFIKEFLCCRLIIDRLQKYLFNFLLFNFYLLEKKMTKLNEFLNEYSSLQETSSEAYKVYNKAENELLSYKDKVIREKLSELQSFLSDNKLWNLFGKIYDEYHNGNSFEERSLAWFHKHYNGYEKISISKDGDEYFFSLSYEDTFRGETDYYNSDEFPLSILFDLEKLKQELFRKKEELEVNAEAKALNEKKKKIQKELDDLNNFLEKLI